MTIHVGLIGGGNISGTHARAVAAIPDVKISAVYGANYEKATRLGQEFGGQAYHQLHAFLAHRPMQMVIIGSPSGLHAEQGIAAARQGLHVLVEKPIDITAQRADALIAECAKARVKLGVIFQDRFKSDIRRLKQLMDDGALGRLLLADARVKWYRPPEYYSGSRWRGTWALDGGGALMNQGVHTVDLLLWLLGDVVRLRARTATLLHRIETEDTALALLEFSNGAAGILEATTAAYPGYPRRIEITGTEGTIVLENDRIIVADLKGQFRDIVNDNQNDRADQNPSASSPVVPDFRGHQHAIEDFIHAIQHDCTPACDGREGRRSVALIESIYRASCTPELKMRVS
jgi:UDP-N-acetyl-2-amino-2-deoxyglucuronate dehydrogenase